MKEINRIINEVASALPTETYAAKEEEAYAPLTPTLHSLLTCMLDWSTNKSASWEFDGSGCKE